MLRTNPLCTRRGVLLRAACPDLPPQRALLPRNFPLTPVLRSAAEEGKGRAGKDFKAEEINLRTRDFQESQ